MASNTMFTVMIALVLGAIVIIFFAMGGMSFFRSFSLNPFVKADYNSIDAAAKLQEERNFELLSNNLKACRSVQKQSCMCNDVFFNFPNTFIDDISIKITHQRQADVVSMVYKGNQEIKNFTLDAFVSRIAVINDNVIEENPNYEDIITFSKGEVYFNGAKVLSGGIYKKGISRLGVIAYKSAFLKSYPSEEQQTLAASKIAKC